MEWLLMGWGWLRVDWLVMRYYYQRWNGGDDY